MIRKTFQIPDMQSAHCRMRVKDSLSTLEKVNVSESGNGFITITAPDEENTSKAAQAIERAGYTILQPEPELTGQNETMQFNTNINCGSCVARVAGILDHEEGICHWHADTASAGKTLTVHSAGITREQVIKAVEKAGFTIQPVQS